jgi:methyl-accepting chemotaxis protein
MKKIKIVGALIFILSITLALLFIHTSKEIANHNSIVNTINEQKDFTQEISKNIFYIYKNQSNSTQTLDDSIKKFLQNMKSREHYSQNSTQIIKLWNTFYLHVQHFRDQIKNKSIYSNILIEKSIKNIYNTNLELIIEFDNIITTKQKKFNNRQNIYKIVQYMLFGILVLLLLYVFTQIKIIMTFVQKFLSTSKSIIKNSSIRELKPIEIDNTISDISQAKNNFNTLVIEINSSISYASHSIEHSCKSIEIVEQNIEDLVELIYTMNETARDKELRKKEDAVIQSLEELSTTTRKLKNLKDDLDNLISHSVQTKLKNNN